MILFVRIIDADESRRGSIRSIISLAGIGEIDCFLVRMPMMILVRITPLSGNSIPSRTAGRRSEGMEEEGIPSIRFSTSKRAGLLLRPESHVTTNNGSRVRIPPL